MKAYDRNIPYNSLPDLPPAETFYKDASVNQKLTEASRKLAELKGIASIYDGGCHPDIRVHNL